MITEKHLEEWIRASGVSQKITCLNVSTVTDHQEIDKRLNRNNKRRTKHTDWGDGGWWVSGVDPHTGEPRGIGGQFKPDKPIDDRKYIGISDSAATPLFLDTGDRQYWAKILASNEPILITEGAKKAGAALSCGIAAISLPGVTTGQKLGRLREDLVPFFNVGRRVNLAFDADVMTKRNVQQALDRLGRLIAETGANVSVVSLPLDTKGLDDFIVKNDHEAFKQLVKHAVTFEEWRESLKEDGLIERPKTYKQITLNAIRTRYSKRLRLNIMTKQVEMDGIPLKADHLYLELLDAGIDASKEFVMDAFFFLASKSEFHPVQDYLQMCKLKHGSDTIAFLDKVSSRYLGTKEPIYDVFLRKTLIAAVARAFRPGCKVDTALILQGKQGKRKSSFFSTLAGDWFDDSLSTNTTDKDEKLKLHSTWLMEWAELETIFSRKDVSAVKAFLSSAVDKFRAPFGKSTESYPRHSLIVGTTNSDDFLQDSTGTRRFWVVPIPANKSIEVELLAEERDQLWAAATAAFERGDQWWLTKEEESLSEDVNRQFQRDDSWTEEISMYVEYKDSVSIKEILEKALGIEIGKQDRGMQMRASDLMRSLGWVKFHTKHGKLWRKNSDKGSHVVTDQTESEFQGDYLLNKVVTNYKGSHQSDPVTTQDDYLDLGDYLKPEVVTTKSLAHEEFEGGGDYVTHKKGNFLSQKTKPELQVGDRVIITNLIAMLEQRPGLPLELQVATYELRGFHGDKAQCYYKGRTFSFHKDWLDAIAKNQELQHSA
jgi:predicted P-loop ATPase